VKLVMPVYESALMRDEAGHVLCHVCGCAMQAWTPCEGATWYECDCGEVVLAVKGVTVRDARG
jgi:hypothetical protein